MNPANIIRRVFESVLDDGTPWRHQNAPVTILATKGRCVRVSLSGSPCWSDLALDLLPVCEFPFRLVGRELYAKVKTPAQMEADDLAAEYDEHHGEFDTYGFPDLSMMLVKKTSAPKRERTLGPVAKAISKHIEESTEKTFNRYNLVAAVKKALEEDGRDVRADSIARTLNTQILGTLLEIVPDTDGEELRLKEDDDAEES